MPIHAPEIFELCVRGDGEVKYIRRLTLQGFRHLEFNADTETIRSRSWGKRACKAHTVQPAPQFVSHKCIVV